MLAVKYAAKSRAFLSPLLILNHSLLSSSSPFLFSSVDFTSSGDQFLPPAAPAIVGMSLNEKDVVLSFKGWFKCRKDALLDQIFQILGNQDGDDLASRCAADVALSQLGLRLSEEFVLQVLKHDKNVLSCLKFFDWAGRQTGFHHTRATINAIFKILSQAKLMSLMLDFLDNYKKQRHVYKVRYHDTLVMGYAVAGKPDIALQMFGRMRFQGLDLDSFAYHVLLNALVEESCFDVVEVIVKQIKMRGYEHGITHSIMMKSFCKQDQLDEAEQFLRGLVSSGCEVGGEVLSILVKALCKYSKFEQASLLMMEFQEMGNVAMQDAYSVWLRDLVCAGKLDGALEFLKTKKTMEGYVPDLFRYNILICRLLRENRLNELSELLLEMKEEQISPDKFTMNAALCFFCKAGMVDVALELYNCRSEFGLSPSSMAYNYLINTLCGDGSVDEAYDVLKNSIGQGYFPGQKTFTILADALCREGKLEKMKELVLFALERNFMPSNSTYDKFISALCRGRRVEDGYLLHGELNRINKVANKRTYFNLIKGFYKSNRSDIAARLLIEMQEKGRNPSRLMFRAVIRGLFEMKNPGTQFFRLLEMQLSRQEPDCYTYNLFIDGAGHVCKPELARNVYEMMLRSGIEPNVDSDILMLQSYLRSERISDALNFFNEVRQRRKIGRKLYHLMIVRLCKANKVEIAQDFWREMRVNGLVPSIQCYENLIQRLCLCSRYDAVMHLINDLEKAGRHVTSYMGNILLFHALKSQELYEAWVRYTGLQDDVSPSGLLLGQLIGTFTGHINEGQNIEDIEAVIAQCFPPDVFTYNMLLTRLTTSKLDQARELFNRMCQKGYEPNRWTYDIIIHDLLKNGRVGEARYWMEEMFQKGFDLPKHTKRFI